MELPNYRSARISWWGFVLCLLPALGTLWLIVHYGVDTPWQDDWVNNALLLRAAEHRITFSSLIAQHNDSRDLMSRLWLIFFTRFGHWNQYAEMLGSLCLASFTTLLCLRLAVDTCGRRTSTIVGAFASSALIFSWVQWEAWLWGMTMELFLPPCFLYAAWVTAKRPWPYWLRMALCALLAFAGQFSYSNGLFLWLLLAPVTCFEGRKFRFSWRGGGFWIAAATASCSLYFHGFLVLSVFPGFSALWQNRANVVEFFLAFLGFALTGPDILLRSQAIIGLVVVLAAIGAVVVLLSVMRWQHFLLRALPWIMIGGFSIIGATAVVVYRTNGGVNDPVSSRYVVTAVHLTVATIFLLLLAGEQWQEKFAGVRPQLAAAIVPILAAAAGVMATLYFQTNMQVPPYAAACRRMYLRSKTEVEWFNLLPDREAIRLYFWGRAEDDSTLPWYLNQMNRYGYFRPPMLTMEKFTAMVRHGRKHAGDMSNIAGKFEIAQRQGDGSIDCRGWCWDDGSDTPPGAMILTYHRADNIEHPLAMVVQNDVYRGDLVTNNPQWAQSGWARVVSAADPALREAITITAWAYDPIHCDMHPLQSSMSVPASTSH